jgi:hypothetical protein
MSHHEGSGHNYINNYFFCCCCKREEKKPIVKFNFAIGKIQDKKIRSITTMIESTITNKQKVPVTLSPVSVDPVTNVETPAVVDGIPTWTVESGDSTVLVAADGLSAELISSDVAGDTVVQIDADADPGTGVVTLSDSITLHVTADTSSEASNLGIVIGTPELK